MPSLYDEFVAHLDREDRKACVDFALSRLSRREIDIVSLYNEVLTPALREHFCRDKQREVCVWEEHVRTSIVRTVIECCYPSVVKEKEKSHGSAYLGKALVVCPPEEYHEIGARMIADFFTLCGFEATFIGANTPQGDILEAITYIGPRYVAVSVSHHYNLVAARRTLLKIRETRERTGGRFTIVAGGNAFKQNPGAYREMGADVLLDTFDDIRMLVEKAD
jgi:methanogenic corrinoid protein MtbC1